AELFETVLLIPLLLIIVFVAGGFPFGLVEALNVVPRKADAFAKLVNKTPDGVVDDGTEGIRGARAFPQRPQITKQIWLRATAVTANGGGAECERLRRWGMKCLPPARDARKDFRRRGRGREEVCG